MQKLNATTAIADGRQQQLSSFNGWKDWTNRNILISSIDETVFTDSYQNQETIVNEDSNIQGLSLSLSLSLLLHY